MIKKIEINGKTFIEERTYYVYDNQDGLMMNTPVITTSDGEKFQSHLDHEIDVDRRLNDPFHITMNKLYPHLAKYFS